RRIIGRLDHVRDRGEDEAGGVVERFDFQLPDPVHDDVRRAHGSAKQPPTAMVALYLEGLAHIADEDAVQPAIESAEAGTACRLPECGFEQVSVQPQLVGKGRNSTANEAGMEK